jgi:putative membrane protein
MATALYILKAIHIIGFISWFAGLFYLGRMFVNHSEAKSKVEPERSILLKQFQLMSERVYKIICNPAMMVTWTAGIAMLAIGIFSPSVPNYLSIETGTPGWMHLKLLLLVLLVGYHIWCKRITKNLKDDDFEFDPFKARLFNEIPTLFLVSIVFTASLGRMALLNYAYLAIGVLVFGFLVYRGAVAYRKRRERAEV